MALRKELIRILRFTCQSTEELKGVLALQNSTSAVRNIDLRGNTGGDLFAAVDCASLFLPLKSRIVELKTRHGTQRYASQQPSVNPGLRLFLWQDGQTTSDAQVFIAALTEVGRALSVGQRGFGKGLTQRFGKLPDGSALLLNWAMLLIPPGKAIQRERAHAFIGSGGRALNPDGAEGGYVAKTIQITGVRKP